MLPLMATSDMPYEFIKNEYYPIDYIKRALVAGYSFRNVRGAMDEETLILVK